MNHVCIIAEAGVNHNGSFILAKRMIDVASEAGADYIKFQTFVPKKIASVRAAKAEHQKQSTDASESQLKMLEKLALSFDDFRELKKYCDKAGIGFLSSPFDLDSISFLETLNLDFWKIPSGEITNLPYLERIARTGRPIILSTGMCNSCEIMNALEVLEKEGAGKITLLHCNTQYPTPYQDVNLSAMKTMGELTGKQVGYSDHTMGIEIPIAAAAMGACVIEKHFTLSRDMQGPDHKASLTPYELKKMVQCIRHIESAFGDGTKEVSASEFENIKIARKSIVAATDIKAGEILSENNLTTKRPGTGISPMKWYDVVGTKAVRDFKSDELIEL